MSKLYDIASSYVGTPHINGGMIKGAGVDCCTLPALIYKDMEIADIPIKPGYSADWFCKRDCKEILLPYLEKYFDRVDDLEPLDIVSYAWGRSKYAHLSLYLGEGLYIHAQADNGVEIVDKGNPYFYTALGKSRISGVWRFKK